MARSVLVTVRRSAPRRGTGTAPAFMAADAVGPRPDGMAGAGTLWAATIRGEPTARRRMHEVVLTDGAARLIKSHPARLWQNHAMAQLLNRRPMRPLAVELALECRIWSGAAAGEIDDALLVEVLERAAIIANGRQIRERHLFAAEDHEDPRILVRLARFGGAA